MNPIELIKHNYIEIIQFIGAVVISLIFQFVIPLSWLPMDSYFRPEIQHGDPGTNIVFFTVSQWYFSFSVMWFLKRDNRFINNFLIYSIPPLFMIFLLEFFIFHLFYDYYHLFPLILAFVIIFRYRESLNPKYVLHNITLLTIWLYLVFFLRIAYYEDPLLIFVVKWFLICIVELIIAYSIRKLKILDIKKGSIDF